VPPFYYLCFVLKEFESNIIKSGLFSKKEHLLLAMSGGIDSVVLAHLLKESEFNFSIVHCNFRLRGKDSKADEAFCMELAKQLGVQIYARSFDTKKYCIENKMNVQLAARKLRYDWFKDLIDKHKLDYLLTAHHANDVVETFFINVLRGTGIKGLKGIPLKQGRIVRPLLNFSREEIEAYAKLKKITFRLDKSNLEDKYERNFIRMNVIPLLKKINPKLEDTFVKNTANLSQEAGIVADFLEERAANLITQTPEFVFISKKKLLKEKYKSSVLHHLISGYGFNETQEKNVLQHLEENGLPGKLFSSVTHQLTIDRNDLIIKSMAAFIPADINIRTFAGLRKLGFITCEVLKKFELPKQNELLLSKSRLIFPLAIRTRQTGDKFKPFGMKGFKLLSDFFKDQKMNTFEKENCRLLVNGNGEIIWVMGTRSDERYKTTIQDKDLLKLTFIG